MKKLSWEEFHEDVKRLITCLGDYRPDIIVPCMLGGLVPGAIIAKELGINDVRPIDIVRTGNNRRIAYDVIGELEGKSILLVEDDLPTRIGLAMVREKFEQRGAKVKVAAVYVSQKGKEIADFFVKEIEPDDMPDYPWKKFNCDDRSRL